VSFADDLPGLIVAADSAAGPSALVIRFLREPVADAQEILVLEFLEEKRLDQLGEIFGGIWAMPFSTPSSTTVF